MCQTAVRKILKHALTRWLSLGKCVCRLIAQWGALEKFFEKEANHKPATNNPSSKTSATPQKNACSAPKSTSSNKSLNKTKYVFRQQHLAGKKDSVTSGICDKPLTKSQLIHHFLADPLSRVYALFLQHPTLLFERANLLLQRETLHPCSACYPENAAV